MKALSLTLLGLLGLIGCKDNDLTVELPDGAIIKYVNCDGGSVIPDMTTKPPCAAATGLGGKNLYCVDFSNNTTNSISALTGAGWTFSDCVPSNPAGVKWTISLGKLQIDTPNFTNFSGDCKFTMPTLSSNDLNSHSAFMLSVVHTVSLNDGITPNVAPQVAQIYLGAGLIASSTSKQPTLQWSQTLTKANFPVGVTDFQPVFRLNAPGNSGAGFTGWKIDSVAIQGLP